MAFSAPGLYSRVRTMLPEVLKFGVVGGIGSVVDLGGTAVLHSEYHAGPLFAKAVAVTAATTVTYLGSRFWTFKDRENQSARREAVLFVVLNVAGLLIAEAVIGLVTYVMGLNGKLEFNAASVIGTGLGTIFRFYAYRKWVFLAPDQSSAASMPLPMVRAFPDYPPWELDPSFLDRAGAAVAAPAQVPAPVYAASVAAPSSWDQPPASAWGAQSAGQSWEQTEHLPRRLENSSLPNGRVATPHRTALPSTGQEERRHSPTGPTAPPTAPRPSGRHRRN